MTGPASNIVERARKLLALRDHAGTNENEAALAASKLQELLAEHNLSMATVEASQARSGVTSSPETEKREKKQHERSAMYRYQQDLMRALAKNNFCMYFMTDVRAESFGKERIVKRHVLLGRESNVAVTQLTYDYLVDALDRLLPYEGMQKRGKDALLWLSGGADRLVERLDALRDKMETESAKKAQDKSVRAKHPGAATTGNALVVLADVYGSERDLNADALEGLEPGTTARRRREHAAEQSARVAAMAAKEKELLAMGHPEVNVWYLARGLQPPAPSSTETDAQRRRRLEREARQNNKWQDRYNHRLHKDAQRRADPVYRAGASKADEIGLDDQIGRDERNKIGRS